MKRQLYARLDSDIGVRMVARFFALAIVSLPVMLPAGAIAKPAAEPGTIYACAKAEHLVVHEHKKSATVSLGGQSFFLPAKPSSIGRKYSSKRATLIIDGPSAVLITADRFDLGECVARS